jgi:hypothetical protein
MYSDIIGTVINGIKKRFITEDTLLFGTATCGLASVAATTSASFSGTVTGASIGDRVLVTPPAALGSAGLHTNKLSFHAYVSAANTVTIQLCNANASTTAILNPSVQTAWKIMIIKE